MYGTLATLDALSSVQDPISSFGEDTLVNAVVNALAVHNGVMQAAIADFAMVTNERQLGYGTTDDLVMQELDQFGSPDAQKGEPAGSLGLPLRFYGVAVQWNLHYMRNTSVAAFMARLDSMAVADVKNVYRQLKKALMKPTNTTNYVDQLMTVNGRPLTYNLYALLNGDGMAIPSGANGEVFDAATHNHYNASASLTEAAFKANIDDVVEHGVTSLAVYINRADEATVRTFAGFIPYLDQRERPRQDTPSAMGSLDATNPADRAIGIFEGAEVWVKNAMVPANYQIAFDRGGEKALGIRTRSGSFNGDAYDGGFGLMYDDENHPLRAKSTGREFGVGVINRHKAAVNFSAGTTYVAPAGL